MDTDSAAARKSQDLAEHFEDVLDAMTSDSEYSYSGFYESESTSTILSELDSCSSMLSETETNTSEICEKKRTETQLNADESSYCEAIKSSEQVCEPQSSESLEMNIDETKVLEANDTPASHNEIVNSDISESQNHADETNMCKKIYLISNGHKCNGIMDDIVDNNAVSSSAAQEVFSHAADNVVESNDDDWGKTFSDNDGNIEYQPDYWFDDGKSEYITIVRTFTNDPEHQSWWHNLNGVTDVIAFDCESVQVPLAVEANARPRNKQQCALLSVVDFGERSLLDIRVRYPRNSFIVSRQTISINGIGKHDLQNGFTLNEVAYLFRSVSTLPPFQRNIVHNNWRIVLTWGEQDTSYLPTPENIRHIDLQEYFTQCSRCRQPAGGAPINCGHRRQRLGLAAVVWHYYRKHLHKGIHFPRRDAKFTMRLFKDFFLPVVQRTDGHFEVDTVIDRHPPKFNGNVQSD